MQIENEKRLESKLTDKVKALGGGSIKLLSTHTTGLPDRICLFPGGRILFIEVKTTRKKPTKIQSLVHDKLRSLGFRVEVIDTSEQLEKIVREYEV